MGFLLPLAGDLLGGLAEDAVGGAAEDAVGSALKGAGKEAGEGAEAGGNPLGDIVNQVLGGGDDPLSGIGNAVNQILGGGSGDSDGSGSVGQGPLAHLGPGLEIPPGLGSEGAGSLVGDAVDAAKSTLSNVLGNTLEL